MPRPQHRSFAQPEETRTFPRGTLKFVTLDEIVVGHYSLEPGWKWSNDVKPIAKTDSCEAPHFQYHVAGHIAIRMDDGTEFVAGPGDVTALPSGHDAWVVGDQPAVVVDWCGATSYGKAAKPKKKPAAKKKAPTRKRK